MNREKLRHQSVYLAGASAIALAFAAPAIAQDADTSEGEETVRTMNTVIVTTQKAEETLQDVPIAVSAFDEGALDRLNINTGSELQFNIPNFQSSQGNFTAGSIGIRGIVNAAVAASSDASVGMHINNVPTATTPILETEFYDTERIEILRGPQGTLYGRNASGGLVNVITAKPSDEFTANLDFEFGDYDMQKLSGHVNIPVGDYMGLRVAGFTMKRDGYTDAVFHPSPSGPTSIENVDDRDLYGYRITFGGDITDNLSGYVMWDTYEEEDRRVRSAKQFCTVDTRPFPFNQGCVPYEIDGLGYARDANGNPVQLKPGLGAVNNAGTLAGVVGSNLGVIGTFGTNTNDGATVPTNLRLYETTVLPEYEANRDLFVAELSYEFDNGLTLTGNYSKMDRYRESSDDYNKLVGLTTAATTFNPLHPLTPDLDGDGFGNWPGAAALGITPPVDTRLPAGAASIVATDNSSVTDETTTAEIRLQSAFDGPFNFNVGAIKIDSEIETNYYVFFNTAEMLAPATGLPIDRTYFRSRSPYELDALGVFAEGYYDVNDDIKLTLGLRYTSDDKSQLTTPSLLLAPPTTAPGVLNGEFVTGTQEASFEEITGRIGFDWQLGETFFSDSTMLYAFYSRGYKGGGINPPQSAGLAGVSDAFDPEFINSYEIGTKSTVLDGRASLNVTGFYYDYEGYQISSIVNRTSVNLNVDAEVKGLEAEFYAQLTDNFAVDVTFGYLDTELADNEFIDTYDQTGGDPNWIVAKNLGTTQNCIVNRAQAEALLASPFAATSALVCNGPTAISDTIFGILDDPTTTLDDATVRGIADSLQPAIAEGNAVQVGGNALPRAPETTLSIGAQYTWFLGDWEATMRGDYYTQAEMYTRIFNLEADKIDSWSNANASISFEQRDWGLGIEFYAKNIFEDDQITNQYLTDASSGLYTNVFLLDPRQFGMKISKEW